MGMGMQAASATFQSIMDRVLRGLESFTASYIDGPHHGAPHLRRPAATTKPPDLSALTGHSLHRLTPPKTFARTFLVRGSRRGLGRPEGETPWRRSRKKDIADSSGGKEPQCSVPPVA
eukprot:scaffold3905_cov122-Isochrysis_galbana.AAC.3